MNRSIEILINNHPVRVELAENRARPKVACLGPEGTYTEAARYELLGEYLDEMDAEFLPYNATVVQKVNTGDYDIGIVPVENGIEGDVSEVLRELNHAKNLTILGETILPIQHMLIGWPEEEIEAIHSHPQALGQCRAYLLDGYPGIDQIPTASTTAAVKEVLKNKRIAAIASRRAAQIYNLPILAEDIGDIKGNSTRFLMLGRGETKPTGEDTTSLVLFPKEDYPGILWKCLGVFKRRGINTTKLDSHPTGELRRYMFMTLIDGHKEDTVVRSALNSLRSRYCSSVKVLGSYKKAPLPEGVREPGAINGTG